MPNFNTNALISKIATSSWNISSTSNRGIKKYVDYPEERATLSFGSDKCAAISCYIAANDDLKSRGLQGFDKLGQVEGVLFPFKEPRTATFHMGDVKFPIDIIFIGGDGRVNKIIEDAQPGSTEKWAMGRVAAVVETNSGFCKTNNVRVGSDLVYVDGQRKTAQESFPTYPRKDINPAVPDLNPVQPAERFKDRDLVDVQVDHQPVDGKHYEQVNGYDPVTFHDDETQPAVRAGSKGKSMYFDDESKAKRRAARQTKYASLAGSFSKTSSKITRQNVGSSAINFISDYFAEYRLPGIPKYVYSGARVANIDSGKSEISEAVITVSANMKTNSGVRVDFEVPIQVRAGQFLDPSIIVVDGLPKVIAQSTFDTLNDQNSIFDLRSERKIFSPPDPAAQHIVTRRPGLGMYDSTKLRNVVSSGLYKSSKLMDENLDPAEDHDARITPGEKHLRKAVEVKDRGGATHNFASGSKVTVLRDHAGDGKVCVVRFPTGLEALLDCDCVTK